MTLEHNRALGEQFVAVINGRNFALLDKVLSADFSLPRPVVAAKKIANDIIEDRVDDGSLE